MTGSTSLLPDPETSDMTIPVARVISEARRAAIAEPGSAAAVGRYCQLLHAHWRLGEAAACYEIAHRLAPQDFRWVYLLAGVEEIHGADAGHVEELFRKAIRLAPGFAPVYVRYADALLRLGRWSEARDNYVAALERDSGLVMAHRGLGQAATLLGDLPLAVEQLEQAGVLSPQDRITQVALARVYTLTGRGEQAAKAARKAREFKSEASLPDQFFFEIEGLAVDPESLRKRLALSLQKGNYDAAIEAAMLLEESGAPAARQQMIMRIKRRAMEFAVAGDFDAALVEFERAVRLAPNDAEIEHNWGTLLLRSGELEGAKQHFEKAIEINPQSADSFYNLGLVLEGLGRSDEAIARFNSAALINPQHVAAKRLAELGIVPES
jgi:tetratricopeptide (TPR) repeat protein